MPKQYLGAHEWPLMHINSFLIFIFTGIELNTLDQTVVEQGIFRHDQEDEEQL